MHVSRITGSKKPAHESLQQVSLSPLRLLTLLGFSLLAACGGQEGESGNFADAAGGRGAGSDAAGEAAGAGDLTAWELENGIGPVTEPLELGEIDPDRAARGEEIFNLKCSACHKLDDRYVAPPLRDVTSRRTPEFVMNMILNPLEMTQRHPATKELLAEYFTPMTPQGLTEEDARALLDFFRRAYAQGPPES